MANPVPRPPQHAVVGQRVMKSFNLGTVHGRPIGRFAFQQSYPDKLKETVLEAVRSHPCVLEANLVGLSLVYSLLMVVGKTLRRPVAEALGLSVSDVATETLVTNVRAIVVSAAMNSASAVFRDILEEAMGAAVDRGQRIEVKVSA